MKILVTGGHGTIGSCLVAKLIKQQHDVIVYDNGEVSTPDNLLCYLSQEETRNIKIISDNILNIPAINEALNGVDICYHMAATLGTLNVVRQPSKMLKVNILGTQNIIEQCAKRSIPIVIASTSMVYGNNPKATVNEEDELFIGGNVNVGLWWYAVSKMADECFARAIMSERKDAKIMILRPFNVIAPIQNGSVGFVFPRFIKAALENEPLYVYGNGEQRRTFTWVENFIRCTLELVENEVWNQTINIGGVEEIMIKELASVIIQKTNSKSEINYMDPQELFLNQFTEIDRRIPDTKKLKNLIGYTPDMKITEMIDKFIAFYKKPQSRLPAGHY